MGQYPSAGAARAIQRTTSSHRANSAAAERAYSEQLRIEAYNARMAPIWAQQRRDAAELALQQQRADALSAIAGAARLEALTDRQRLAIQARRAGYPQVGLGQSVPPVP
jgi:ABC-type amino acid transport substrate-binding protein